MNGFKAAMASKRNSNNKEAPRRLASVCIHMLFALLNIKKQQDRLKCLEYIS